MSTCTLGQSPFPYIEHPGPVVGFVYHDVLIPRWAGDYLRAEADRLGYGPLDMTPVHPYQEPIA